MALILQSSWAKQTLRKFILILLWEETLYMKEFSFIRLMEFFPPFLLQQLGKFKKLQSDCLPVETSFFFWIKYLLATQRSCSFFFFPLCRTRSNRLNSISCYYLNLLLWVITSLRKLSIYNIWFVFQSTIIFQAEPDSVHHNHIGRDCETKKHLSRAWHIIYVSLVRLQRAISLEQKRLYLLLFIILNI